MASSEIRTQAFVSSMSCSNTKLLPRACLRGDGCATSGRALGAGTADGEGDGEALCCGAIGFGAIGCGVVGCMVTGVVDVMARTCRALDSGGEVFVFERILLWIYIPEGAGSSIQLKRAILVGADTVNPKPGAKFQEFGDNFYTVGDALIPHRACED